MSGAARLVIGVVRRLAADRAGGTLVEFTLTLLIMLTMTFGVIEFGYAGYQWANAEAATQRGVRIAATRAEAVTNIPDCGPGVTGVSVGQPCSSAAGSYNWTCRCDGAGGAPICSAGSGMGCDATTLARILQEMQRSYPALAATNIRVTFSGAGLGFQGLGRPIPLVTVEVTGLTFDFIALDGLIGLPDQISMPAFRASLSAEDLQGT